MTLSTNLNTRLLLTIASLTFASLSTGCFYGDTDNVEFKGPPSGDAFKPVSGVLERRCGTLDCHGSVYRPLRIYGQGGLRRRDSMNVSGGVGTTDDELADNYQSAISLEPEIMQLVLARKAFPDALTLIRKPLLLEKHKGGPVLSQSSSAGYTCLKDWVLGNAPDANNCAKEK